MCGIAGFLSLDRSYPNGRAVEIAGRMADAILHRGPDAGGTFADEAVGIAFGHRRLSIIDLSEAGAQPMASASGRSVICYNGEIYNADELRRELGGRNFRGHSDTEILVEAFEAWGVEATARRLIGMYALAWWDGAGRRLWLLRDRVGKKPLYYGRFGRTVLFGSQLKSMAVHPDWRGEIDPGAIASYLRFGYFSSRRSVFKGVRQLSPGTAVAIPIDGAGAGNPEEIVYWDVDAVVRAGASDPLPAGAETADAFDALLADAVKRRMVADVPLGAFLSGGIDSSVVVSLMQRQSTVPIKTFSIGFAEQAFDEAPYARAVADHLGTDHHELYVAPERALELIPRLAEWFDEPFADPSQIPTLLVCELARTDVKVSLSGDGGDELFHGYPRYRFGAGIHRLMGLVPDGARAGLARGLLRIPTGVIDGAASIVPSRLRPERVGDRVHKLAVWMGLPTEDLVYREISSLWSEPAAVVEGAAEFVDPAWTGMLAERVPDFIDRMPYIDLITYLPDDILAKVDRASMAVSLEARAPLLDHRVVEFAWRLPRALKLHRGETKVLLRRVLDRYVPRRLFERPKQGFEVPIAEWLRGPLRGWGEELLDAGRLSREGLFDPRPIRRQWEEHLAGRRNWQRSLWTILMFQVWRERWL